MSFACVLHSAMSSSAFHLHVFQTLHPFGFRRFSPLSILRPATLTRARRTSQTLFREREKNFLEMDRDLSSGLGISSVDRPSNFVPFGGHLMPQRLTELTETPLFSCSPAPLHTAHLAHLNPLHALRRWITIVWAKTAPHSDFPSFLYTIRNSNSFFFNFIIM